MISRVSVNTGAERAWEVLSAASRWPDWSSVCVDVWNPPDEMEWRVGHEFGFKLRMAHRQVPFNVTISEVEKGRLIEWRSTKFSITATRSISINPMAEGCEVTDFKKFSSPILPIGIAYPRRIIRRMTDSWLHDLKIEAESSE